MTDHRMQVLVDGEWQDVSAVSDFEFAVDAEMAKPEPMLPTSFTMTTQVDPEGVEKLRGFIAKIEREGREERARRRMWLRFPYRGAVVR